MNYHELLKLRNNPHYKMSAKQTKQLADFENDPVVLFGIIEPHNNTFEQHNVKVKKYGRKQS